MRPGVLALVAAILAACATERAVHVTSAPGRITVVEFATRDAKVSGYDGPAEPLGLALASEVAAELRRRGHTAEVAPATAPLPADGVVVRGRLRLVDCGNRDARSPGGAGTAKIAADGDVVQADGGLVASFHGERQSSGSDEAPVQQCLRAVGTDIAEMVDTGRYRY